MNKLLIWRLIVILSTTVLCSTQLFADKTAGQVVDDATLQTQVKTKLLGSDFSSGSKINTEVRKGVVQLGGFVNDASTSAQAAAVAADVYGVKLVDNQLHAKPAKRTLGQKLDDSLITTKAKSSIADAKLGDGFKVNVDTYIGVVLLTGFVDTQAQKDTAGTRAANVANVKSLINGIYVLD